MGQTEHDIERAAQRREMTLCAGNGRRTPDHRTVMSSPFDRDSGCQGTVARSRRCERGSGTISFILTMFWTMLFLLIFLQFALIGYTWQVTGYAAFASARARIVGRLFNSDYKDVAANVMKGSLPDGWGNTWIVQELPFGIGVVVLYGQKVVGIPVPVVGRAEVPYSKLNPFDPAYDVWDKGDNR